MYYLVDRKQLPGFLQGKYFETVPDGRVVITEFELKMVPHIGGVEMFATYRDLKAYIDAEGKKKKTTNKTNKGGE